MKQYIVLTCKVAGDVTTKSTSTVASATVTKSAKTFSQADKSFGSSTKDQWEPDENIIEKLTHEVQNFLFLYGVNDSRYKNKVKELEWTKKSDKRYWESLQAVQAQTAK
ncbi:MAG: hypothetical protein GY861_22930 [bacterium]|nr:hypothetical protein [bacterium]